MRTTIAIVALCAAVSGGGCAGWSHPTAGETQFYADRYACEHQAASTYPVAMTQRPAAQRPSQTNCTAYGSNVSCTTQPTGIDASIYHVATDANLGYRTGAFRSCMLAKGWRN